MQINPLLLLSALLFILSVFGLFALAWVIRLISRRSRAAKDMHKKLGKATEAESALAHGKEMQKKFLPLDIDSTGNTANCGSKDTKNAHFFGYYEGAKGISGDYFDYKDLDGRYFAIIKCDVAGKGVPAALIMIQVATMFINYFKNWKLSISGMHIQEVVYQINGFIETMGFGGRFAAFTLCLFDSETGDLHFCNAGDNILHICDTSEKSVKSITLPASPAAGILSNSMVESHGGYQVQTITLDHGDLLLLYTDGIEESRRTFRNAYLREIVCTKNCEGIVHNTHQAGQSGETMGAQRMQDIVNAVLNRQSYYLKKWHNHERKKELLFDFSPCNGSAEEVILALISAEKMFRIYRSHRFTGNDRVLVDKKIDVFLKKHFLQYELYCSKKSDCPDNESYIYYTHLREDEQYDDLAILGVKRK